MMPKPARALPRWMKRPENREPVDVSCWDGGGTVELPPLSRTELELRKDLIGARLQRLYGGWEPPIMGFLEWRYDETEYQIEDFDEQHIFPWPPYGTRLAEDATLAPGVGDA